MRMIVLETCDALWKILQSTHMPVPDAQICKHAAEEYWTKWNFPNCFGSIDGKHIRIQCPTKSGSQYYNYKQFFSLVLQGVADARCRFLTIDIGAMGKQSDGGVFSSSDLFRCLENNAFNLPESMPIPNTNVETPLMLVGDEAYPLLPYLMRPFPHSNLNIPNKIFNYRLSRARRSVECAFGIMASKFRILHKSIETQVEFAEHIVKACCILHNVIIDKEGTDYDLFDETSTSAITPLPTSRKRQSRNLALNLRNTLKEFFISE